MQKKRVIVKPYTVPGRHVPAHHVAGHYKVVKGESKPVVIKQKGKYDIGSYENRQETKSVVGRYLKRTKPLRKFNDRLKSSSEKNNPSFKSGNYNNYYQNTVIKDGKVHELYTNKKRRMEIVGKKGNKIVRRKLVREQYMRGY
jgi:hypothetical protein